MYACVCARARVCVVFDLHCVVIKALCVCMCVCGWVASIQASEYMYNYDKFLIDYTAMHIPRVQLALLKCS